MRQRAARDLRDARPADATRSQGRRTMPRQFARRPSRHPRPGAAPGLRPPDPPSKDPARHVTSRSGAARGSCGCDRFRHSPKTPAPQVRPGDIPAQAENAQEGGAAGAFDIDATPTSTSLRPIGASRNLRARHRLQPGWPSRHPRSRGRSGVTPIQSLRRPRFGLPWGRPSSRRAWPSDVSRRLTPWPVSGCRGSRSGRPTRTGRCRPRGPRRRVSRRLP